MNEFDFEVRQRASIARAARHEVNGVKSKRCSLPSDNLTHAQWKKRNGKVMTYKMNEPVSWDVFKTWPKDIQAQYLKELNSRFEITARASAYMFGITDAYCAKLLGEMGFSHLFTQGSADRAEIRRFQEWVDGGWKLDAAPAETPEDPVLKLKPSVFGPMKEKHEAKVLNASLHLLGTAEEVADVLRRLVGTGRLDVTVSINALMEETSCDG